MSFINPSNKAPKIQGPVYLRESAPPGSLKLTPALEQNLKTFFSQASQADVGQVFGRVKKTEPSLEAPGANFPTFARKDIGEAVKTASLVAESQFSNANGLGEGRAFDPQKIHAFSIDGKQYLAVQFEESKGWMAQKNQVVAIVDPLLNKVTTLITGGKVLEAPFSDLPTK
jgi:hypothetical protein